MENGIVKGEAEESTPDTFNIDNTTIPYEEAIKKREEALDGNKT